MKEATALAEIADSSGCGCESDDYYECVSRSVDEGKCEGGAGGLEAACQEPLLMLVVCLASSDHAVPPSDAGASAAQCAAIENGAGQVIVDVIGAKLACESDADCTTIEVVGDCFDKCSHVVAKSVAAQPGSLFDLENQTCTGFVEAGCTVTHPACAPPSTPRCVEGACR